MMDGVIQHADSTGGGGVIRDGATQWMTAGKGILHIETLPHDVVATGGWFHGLQLWVNLPRAKKSIDPRYQDLEADRVTLVMTATATPCCVPSPATSAGSVDPGRRTRR